MNSLPDIEEVKDKSIKKGNNAFRVYRMLPLSERPSKKGRHSDLLMLRSLSVDDNFRISLFPRLYSAPWRIILVGGRTLGSPKAEKHLEFWPCTGSRVYRFMRVQVNARTASRRVLDSVSLRGAVSLGVPHALIQNCFLSPQERNQRQKRKTESSTSR